MEIREMQIADIEARFAEIDAEMKTDGADLNALEAEVNQLNERKAELRKLAEERKLEAEKAVAEGVAVKTFEERTMEKTFTPDSVEYRDAYLKALMGKSMDIEERAALASAASVIPTETLNKIYGTFRAMSAYRRQPPSTTPTGSRWVTLRPTAPTLLAASP